MADGPVRIEIDREVLRAVHDVLFDLGEVEAAGAPFAWPAGEETELLATFLRVSRQALGLPDRTA